MLFESANMKCAKIHVVADFMSSPQKPSYKKRFRGCMVVSDKQRIVMPKHDMKTLKFKNRINRCELQISIHNYAMQPVDPGN